MWRDESKLPLSELQKAMATWDTDGQGDPTGNDSGQEPTGEGERPPSTTPHSGPN